MSEQKATRVSRVIVPVDRGEMGGVLVTPGWVTPKGAADYLQVSESTLYALRRAGDGPRYAKRGQLVRYSIEDLDAWMRQNMENPNENE